MQQRGEERAGALCDQLQNGGVGSGVEDGGAGGPLAQGPGRCVGRAGRPRPWQVGAASAAELDRESASRVRRAA